ncbi:MAG TPA: SDR family NAD(P)-dependent oxidoreductase [Steroidobacteraceae bacterium]|nr:SDR family NAD(P)-dependent oxidoreductase [Steroidobacteraceae bacterium]
MTAPLARPRRKNPVLRTPQPLLPPWARSRAALGLTAAAALGRFELQVCERCAAVQYPPREACHRCLCDALVWREQSGAGALLATTIVHHSHDLYFRERVPWRLGLVQLDAGPTVLAHLVAGCAPAPSRVWIGARLDKSGQGVLLAFPTEEVPNMADDRELREMSCDPKYRKVLVTDGKTRVGQATVRALIDAGADLVWVGYAEPWKKFPGFAELEALPQATLVPLDVTDSRSVKEVAAEIGGKVDILVNTAEMHRAHGIASRSGVDVARSEMDVNYFGLLRLAQEFGPVMRSRGADGPASATAWVNVLSIYALTNYPPQGTFSASKAAAFSLSQCLRAEMRAGGVRVINVFPGPLDDEWNQSVPPPKLSPEALAKSIVKALQDGVEDAYPGDVAQEWLARFRESPKTLERELSAAGG